MTINAGKTLQKPSAINLLVVNKTGNAGKTLLELTQRKCLVLKMMKPAG
jgi:hypothetical protein